MGESKMRTNLTRRGAANGWRSCPVAVDHVTAGEAAMAYGYPASYGVDRGGGSAAGVSDARHPPRTPEHPSGLHPRAGAAGAVLGVRSSRRGVRRCPTWTPRAPLSRRAARRCRWRTAHGSVCERTASTHRGACDEQAEVPVVLILLVTASSMAASGGAQTGFEFPRLAAGRPNLNGQRLALVSGG